MTATPVQADSLNPDDPIEIADRVWWVGRYLEGDPFQCHVYLIENGDASVLIDPGSQLTIDTTLRKIERIVPFDSIKYFVLHHQDPDIAGAMPAIDRLVTRPDAVILSHWRAIALLRHYDLQLPFECVEEHGWAIDIGGRRLEFIFTPYLHFPGAFVTFDRTSGLLFSSDIFGGFTEGWSLFAEDEGYLEAMRPFHEHYMPSRDLLFHGLAKLEAYPIRMICPQHGSIIPEPLVPVMIKELKGLECGIYTLVQTSSEVQHLSRLNAMLRAFTETLILRRDLSTIARDLIEQISDVLPVSRLCFFAQRHHGRTLLFDAATHYRGVDGVLPPPLDDALGIGREQWVERFNAPYLRMGVECACDAGDEQPFVLPLFSPDDDVVHGFAVLAFPPGAHLDPESAAALVRLSVPLSVALEREVLYRSLDRERQKFYERSIRDPLTGLYTRLYMQETVQRFLDLHDRDANAGVAVVILDLDHFKSINDNYGHHAGDQVLRTFAEVLRASTRYSDVAVRLGGEEFAVFIVGSAAPQALRVAERIRVRLAKTDLGDVLGPHRLTVSAGVAIRRQHESIDQLLERADVALYRAKNAGRNCIREAETNRGRGGCS